MDLSHYLDQGEFDSHGRFTMDPLRARELLRQYVLPDPRHYAVSLVSFLVGMGAGSVSVQAFSDRLEIKATGLELPRELLGNPLEGLLSGRDHPVLRELALGMNAALGVANQILLRSGGFEGRYGQRFEVSESPGEHTLFVVQTRPGGELEALSCFANCSVDIFVQGRKISAALDPPSDCFVLELAGKGLALGDHPARHVLAHPAPLQAACWLGQIPPRCSWVYLGRTYETALPWTPGDLGLQLWVACDHLDRDLSLQHLQQNERYQSVCEYLRAQLARGLDEVLELFLGGWQPPQLRPVVLYALEHLAAGGQLELALELQRALGVRGRTDQLRLDLLERRTVVSFEAEGTELIEAARAFQAIKGARHHVSSHLLFRAGEAAYKAGDYAQAARFFEPYLLPDPPRSEEVRAQHGHCLLLTGKLQEARHHLSRAIRAGGEHSWVTEALEDLATVDAALGYPKEAFQTLHKVLSRRQALAGSRSSSLGLVLRKMAALSNQMGDSKGVDQYERWAASLDQQ
ncbi:MAG: tetratricopeptide repeat protein [Vulcanimicrobiota bacterium]